MKLKILKSGVIDSLNPLNHEITFYSEGGNRGIFIADIIIGDFKK